MRKGVRRHMGNSLIDKKHGNDNIDFVVWMRAIACLFILMCHYAQQSKNGYVVLSAQFFNIGNDIFFIISGYCFGIQNKITSWSKWYKKRAKRIYISYELMLSVLIGVNLVMRTKMDVFQWGAQIMGMQGWNGVNGAVHTWFITCILLCYLITPILEGLRECKKKSVIVLMVLPIILTYFAGNIFTERNLIIPICWYAIAYLSADWIGNIEPSGKVMGLSLVVMMAVFFARFFARVCIDGTVLYNILVAGYTHAIGAFCIVILVKCLVSVRGGRESRLPENCICIE